MSVVFAGKEQGSCLYHEWCPMQQRKFSIILKIISIRFQSKSTKELTMSVVFAGKEQGSRFISRSWAPEGPLNF